MASESTHPTSPRSFALTLAATAAVAVPGLDPARLALPQHSDESTRLTGVIDMQGRHWEVHQALTDAAGAALDAEAEVLRRIGARADDGLISFNVARVAGSLRQAHSHVQVRTHIEGRPLTLTQLRPGPGLSSGLGRVLGELHELPHTVVSESGFPVYDADEVRQQWLSLLDDAAMTGKVPPSLLNRWEQVLDDTALWRFRPTVVHGDLAEENIVTAGGAVVSLRGWTSVHVGDPAEDLAWLYANAPVDCLDSIEAAYDLARTEGVDKHLRDRAEFVSEMNLARWLLHGVRSQDARIIDDGVAMLADLAAQVGDEPMMASPEPYMASVPPLDEAEGNNSYADDSDSSADDQPTSPVDMRQYLGDSASEAHGAIGQLRSGESYGSDPDDTSVRAQAGAGAYSSSPEPDDPTAPTEVFAEQDDPGSQDGGERPDDRTAGCSNEIEAEQGREDTPHGHRNQRPDTVNDSASDEIHSASQSGVQGAPLSPDETATQATPAVRAPERNGE